MSPLVLLGLLLATAMPGAALAAPTISEYNAGNGPLSTRSDPTNDDVLGLETLPPLELDRDQAA